MLYSLKVFQNILESLFNCHFKLKEHLMISRNIAFTGERIKKVEMGNYKIEKKISKAYELSICIHTIFPIFKVQIKILISSLENCC